MTLKSHTGNSIEADSHLFREAEGTSLAGRYNYATDGVPNVFGVDWDHGFVWVGWIVVDIAPAGSNGQCNTISRRPDLEDVAQAKPRRVGLSASWRAELWQRWRNGQSLGDIERVLGKRPGSIHRVFSSNGGISPADRRRSLAASVATTYWDRRHYVNLV